LFGQLPSGWPFFVSVMGPRRCLPLGVREGIQGRQRSRQAGWWMKRRWCVWCGRCKYADGRPRGIRRFSATSGYKSEDRLAFLARLAVGDRSSGLCSECEAIIGERLVSDVAKVMLERARLAGKPLDAPVIPAKPFEHPVNPKTRAAILRGREVAASAR